MRWRDAMWTMSLVPAPRSMLLLEAGAEDSAVAEVSIQASGIPLTMLRLCTHRTVDRLQTQVDHYESIISRLFPGKDVATLVSLPREELINLALTTPAAAPSPSSGSEPIRQAPVRPQKSDGADSLEALEQAPDQDLIVDEAKRHRDKVQGLSDDVNGLSLSVDHQSSYVGVSSISAALKVIFKTAPVARPFIV